MNKFSTSSAKSCNRDKIEYLFCCIHKVFRAKRPRLHQIRLKTMSGEGKKVEGAQKGKGVLTTAASARI